jgi:hypothetical protein
LVHTTCVANCVEIKENSCFEDSKGAGDQIDYLHSARLPSVYTRSPLLKLRCDENKDSVQSFLRTADGKVAPDEETSHTVDNLGNVGIFADCVKNEEVLHCQIPK